MFKSDRRLARSKHLNFLLYSFFAILVMVGFLNLKQASAAINETILYGQAWSDNIGWISFNNCPTEGSENCGAIDYSVKVNNITGVISGAAWSDNIGWIKFDGLSENPLGEEGDALLNFDNGAVTGWIRACAGTLAGNCSTMESRTDGWDGWIKLSDERYHFSPQISGEEGVTYDEENQKLVGNAWGGEVVGWINFYDVSFGPPDIENFDYELTNTSPSYELEIGQGEVGNMVVNRNFISGTTQESVNLSSVSAYGSEITISIITNNPCNISWLVPNCPSIITIDVDPSVPLGNKTFTVRGVSDMSGILKTTVVNFRVVESAPSPQVSCAPQSYVYYPGETVVWEAVVTNPTGQETFVWSGGNIDSCTQQFCEVSYDTIGPKHPMVSINDGVSFSECEIANILPRSFQMLEF